MKPIKDIDLYFCLNKTLCRISDNKNKQSMIIIETSKKNIRLDCDEIYYCITFSPYIDIHTKFEKNNFKKKISEMENNLPSKYFVRCHRSYIVNVKHIKSITKNKALLSNNIKIPISKGKHKEVNDAFINYINE